MVVIVNGKETEQPEGQTVLSLLKDKEIPPEAVVVERNGDIVPGDAFGSVALEHGDHLEVLRFVGGG